MVFIRKLQSDWRDRFLSQIHENLVVFPRPFASSVRVGPARLVASSGQEPKCQCYLLLHRNGLSHHSVLPNQMILQLATQEVEGCMGHPEILVVSRASSVRVGPARLKFSYQSVSEKLFFTMRSHQWSLRSFDHSSLWDINCKLNDATARIRKSDRLLSATRLLAISIWRRILRRSLIRLVALLLAAC